MKENIKDHRIGKRQDKAWSGIGLADAEQSAPGELPFEKETDPTDQADPISTKFYTREDNIENFLDLQSARSVQSAALEITATAALQQTAQSLAEARTRAHDGSRAAAECHGSDAQNRRLDYVGLLAEMALTDALERHGLKPEGYRFLADRPPSEPDFTLRGKSYDVKACPPGKEFVSVNAGKHENSATRPDYYALCLFQSETAFTVAACFRC